MANVLTISEVAKKLKMSTSAIYKYAELGKIPSFKIGTCLRFFEEEIDAYLFNLSRKQEEKC
jgi:excisionase family DNA binding protein